MTKKKKLIKINYFKFYFISFSLIVGIFSMVLLVASLSAKNRRVANDESRAVAIEKPVVLEPVSNKSISELSENGNFSQFRAGIPVGWYAFPSSGSFMPKLIQVTDSSHTYVNSSSVLIETKVANSGISQILSSEAQTPLFVQANVQVVSGKFKLSVIDSSGVEVGSDETTDDNASDWQRLAIGVTNENVSLRSIRLVATEPDSKAYVTNIVTHPYADYSDLFRQITPESNSQFLSDCLDKNGDEYASCITQKSGLPQDRWLEIGVPKLYLNGEEVKSKFSSPQPQSKTNSKTSLLKPFNNNETLMITKEVKNFYFATDFVDRSDPSNPTYFQKQVKDFLGNAWKDDGIRRQLKTENASMKPFDPTVKSACKEVGYWSKATVYFPDDWCQVDADDRLQYLFLRAGGWDGYYSYDQPRIYIDTNGQWDDIKQIVKHETTHFWGSPDSDFVEIRGNSLFKDGNSKMKSSLADYMYKYQRDQNLKPTEYTVGIVNSVTGFDYHNFWKFQPSSLLIKDGTTDQVISKGKYTIYLGKWSIGHYPGIISPSDLAGFGELDNGIITTQRTGGFLQYWQEIAGFLKIESDDKLYTGKFDLMDLSLAYFRGQNSLEVKVYPIAEGNVKIISPSSNDNIYSLDDIRGKVQPPEGSELKEWKLLADINGERKLLGNGDYAMDGEAIYIPAENLRELKDYEGGLDLYLTAKFVISDFSSDENPRKDNGTFQLSDKKLAVVLHKPIIQKVEFVGKNKMLIDGKGFGNSNIIIALREPKTSKVTRISDIQSGFGNSSVYNRTFKIQDDHIEVEIGVPFNPMENYTAEDWSGRVLDIVVIRRDGSATNEYHYGPRSTENKVSSPILILARPPSTFEYDPPSVSAESLTNHFEIKCQQDGTKIILGVETSGNILNHKYSEVRSDCNYNEPIVKDFIMDNNDAESVLDSSQNGKYYWFVCRVLDKNSLGGSQQNDFSDNPISKMLATEDSENSYDCASTGRIKLQRRVYDLTPTPTPTPVVAIEDYSNPPPVNPPAESNEPRCADGSAPWDYINGRCPESASSSIDYTPAQADDTPTPTVYYPYNPDGNTQTEY